MNHEMMARDFFLIKVDHGRSITQSSIRNDFEQTIVFLPFLFLHRSFFKCLFNSTRTPRRRKVGTDLRANTLRRPLGHKVIPV